MKRVFHWVVLGMMCQAAPLLAGNSWQIKDYDTAVKEAATAKKNIILFWQSADCDPCTKVKEQILPQKRVIADLAQFYLVKLSPDDAESKEWTKNFDLSSYPQMIGVDTNGREIDKVVGFHAAESFLGFFHRVKAGIKDPVRPQTAASLRPINNDEWAHLLVNPLAKILINPEDPSEIRDLLDKVPASFIDQRVGLALKWAKAKKLLTIEETEGLIGLLDKSLNANPDLSGAYFTFIYMLPDTIKVLNPEAQGPLRDFALKFLASVRQNPAAYKLSAVDAAKSYVCERDMGVEFAPNTVKTIAAELMRVRSKLLETKNWATIKSDIFGVIHVLSELKEYTLAIDTAEKALPLSSEGYLLRETMAGVMEESGDKEGAARQLREAFHEAPGEFSKIKLARKELDLLVKEEEAEPVWNLVKKVLTYHNDLVAPNNLYRFHFAKFSEMLAGWLGTVEKKVDLATIKAAYASEVKNKPNLLYDLEYFGRSKPLQNEGQQVVKASAMPLVNEATTFRLSLSNLPGWKTYEAVKVQESGKPIAFSVIQDGVKTPLEPIRFPKVNTYNGSSGTYSGYDGFYSFDFILPPQMKSPGYTQLEVDWTACSELCLRGTTTIGATTSADNQLVFHNIYSIVDETASISEGQTSDEFYALLGAMLLSLVLGGIGWRYLRKR